ncbi:MAG: hypothetical protein JOZ83_05785 [Silvibacterium sp.]|nr:hypothetical protein [Silvibacterium sp.]
MLLLFVLLLGEGAAHAQAGSTPDANQQKVRALLDAMVEAMGGQRWVSMQNSYFQGRVSGFYQGKPTGGIEDYFQWRTPSGQERVEMGKKHDDVVIYSSDRCWEATYQGKKPLPKDICEDYQRRREHSIDVAVREWLKDPRTILINEGQTLSERHLTDQVTLISPANDAITIQIDAETHLPRSRTFQYRDPVYHDKNEEREEYDDYHTFDGIPTAFSITRFKNGDMTSQRFLYKAAYNVPLPPDAFNIDAATAKVKK